MARFDVLETEGMRLVRITIGDETVRAESGALSHLRGAIEVKAPVPPVGQAIRCMLSDEPIIRPRYTGTGEIYLTPSLGGYHVLELEDDAWILEDGAYWASDGSVELGLHRERMITSFWAGEGFIDFQTWVGGTGRVVLNTTGPVEEVVLQGGWIAAEGKQIIARTAGLSYAVRRPIRSLIGYYLSGEHALRTYFGEGKVLLTTAPYLNQRLLSALEGSDQ
jgi:uncharacterized protein (AIM24 family)